MSKQSKILDDRHELLRRSKNEFFTYSPNSKNDMPLSAIVWNLFRGKYDFSSADLKWIIDQATAPRVVKNNSIVQITYFKGNATQLKKMVSVSEYDVITANQAAHSLLSSKQQKEFEKTNKIKLAANEVVESSPLGLAIMGIGEKQCGIMVLPACQGGQHIVIVDKIYEPEEIDSPDIQD